MPGSGSLMAGRRVGYFQLALSVVGFAATFIFGGRFVLWYLAHYQHLQQIQMDPGQYFSEIWGPLKWALLGIGLFVLALLWGLVTSMFILSQPPAPDSSLPPRIPPRIAPPRL